MLIWVFYVQIFHYPLHFQLLLEDMWLFHSLSLQVFCLASLLWRDCFFAIIRIGTSAICLLLGILISSLISSGLLFYIALRKKQNAASMTCSLGIFQFSFSRILLQLSLKQKLWCTHLATVVMHLWILFFICWFSLMSIVDQNKDMRVLQQVQKSVTLL